MTMLRGSYLRPLLPMLALGLFLPLWVARAQSQDSQSQSVAEAARQAREKKKAAKTPAPVITNDTLKPAPPPPNPEGAAPSTSGSTNTSAGQAGESNAATTGDKAEAEKKASAEQAKLKQQLEAAQKELGLLQRELTLERDNYYKNPDYVHDTAGKAKLDALNQQIADKQQQVDDLKARLAVLPPSQTSPPSPQP